MAFVYEGFARTGLIRPHFERQAHGHFNVLDYGAVGDGVADDTAALIAACAAAMAATVVVAGRVVVDLPFGIYLVRPTTTLGITVGSNLTVRGPGIVRVASDTGNWAKLFHGATAGTDLSGLTFEDLTIDGNAVANSSATIAVASPTTHQVSIYVAGGDGIRVRNCRFLTAGLNTVVLGGSGARMAVADCQFVFAMRAANAQYDNSAIYTVARDVTIARNQFYGDSLTTPGKGAVTAVETHGGTTSVLGNSCRRFMNFANICTGAASAGKVAVLGNVVEEGNWGIQIWPIDSPGFDGLTIVGNSISLDNVTHNQNNSAGIKVVDSAAAAQPLRNVAIQGNTIRFADEGSGRATDYAAAALSAVESCGIGVRARGNVTNLTVADNTIELAPARGIVVGQAASTPTYANVRIAGNVILNPGQNVALNAAQLHGISIFNNLTDVDVSQNFVKDDYATTRCTYDIFAAPSGGTFTRVKVRGNRKFAATTPLTTSLDTGVMTAQEAPTYTTATRPTAASNTGVIIFVSDGAAGSKFQGSDGSSWLSLG